MLGVTAVLGLLPRTGLVLEFDLVDLGLEHVLEELDESFLFFDFLFLLLHASQSFLGKVFPVILADAQLGEHIAYPFQGHLDVVVVIDSFFAGAAHPALTLLQLEPALEQSEVVVPGVGDRANDFPACIDHGFCFLGIYSFDGVDDVGVAEEGCEVGGVALVPFALP